MSNFSEFACFEIFITLNLNRRTDIPISRFSKSGAPDVKIAFVFDVKIKNNSRIYSGSKRKYLKNIEAGNIL